MIIVDSDPRRVFQVNRRAVAEMLSFF